MEENKKGQEPKKKTVKKVKKDVKLTLAEDLVSLASKLDKTVKEQRGKELSGIMCARLNKIKNELNYIAKTLK